MPASIWSYDLIADIYATDMGQSMPFDDVGFYRATCIERGGRVLELGCGTGRILLPLSRAGLDTYGVDRSLRMLQRLRADAAQAGSSPPPVAQMDLRHLALRDTFATILAPYSLITYLTDDRDLERFLVCSLELLQPGGVLVLDAFVPRPVDSYNDFRQDYRRPHGTGWLQRHKRIQAYTDGTNRIERRYRLLDADDTERGEFVTDEIIRPCTPQSIRAMAASAGLSIQRECYDYDAGTAIQDARFYSVCLQRA